ncbi:MAG: hypothetical protein IJ183_06705 [Prevotella sp.]|nr:hypothetical protein [Prevotella sp.]
MKKVRLLILVLLALLSNNVQGGNVVLFEETFADGLGSFANGLCQDDWLGEMQGLTASKVVVYDETARSLKIHNDNGRNIMCDFGQRISIEKQLYSNFKVSFDYSVNTVSGIYTFKFNVIGSESTENDLYNIFSQNADGEFHTFEMQLDDYIKTYGTTDLSLRFNCDIATDACTIYIKNFKVTADHPYAGLEEVTVASLAEARLQPEGTLVKVTSDKFTLVASGENVTIQYIKDSTSGMKLYKTGTYYIPWAFPGEVLHGNLYGIVSRATGVTELVSPYTDGSVPEDEYESFGAVEIDESELGNYESQLVRFRMTKRTIFEDVLGYYGAGDYTPYNPTYSEGIVGREENGIRYMVSVPCEASVIVVLDDDTPYTYSSLEVNRSCKVIRNIPAGQWATVVLPFNWNASYGANGTIYALFSSATDGILNFTTTKSIISAGTPFLVKSPSAIHQFKGALCSSEVVASEVDGGTYSFCGTFESVTPMVEGCYYIATGNVIKRLSSTGTIKPYRAYFRPNNVAQAKAMRFCVDGEDQGSVTGIDGIMIDPQSGNEKVYNMSGQYVGNSLDELPQGIYIVNGKKVVK